MRGLGVHVSIVPFTRVQLSRTRADLYARLRLPSAEAVGSGSGPFWLYLSFFRSQVCAGARYCRYDYEKPNARSEETKPRIIRFTKVREAPNTTLHISHNTFTTLSLTTTPQRPRRHACTICRTFVAHLSTPGKPPTRSTRSPNTVGVHSQYTPAAHAACEPPSTESRMTQAVDLPCSLIADLIVESAQGTMLYTHVAFVETWSQA